MNRAEGEEGGTEVLFGSLSRSVSIPKAIGKRSLTSHDRFRTISRPA